MLGADPLEAGDEDDAELAGDRPLVCDDGLIADEGLVSRIL